MKTILYSLSLFLITSAYCCSILYYVDENTGNIYVANHEDYWLDTNPYIKIVSQKKGELSRLWYGWDGFGQGGVNEAGVFIDGAVTPLDTIPAGYGGYKGNFTDVILSECTSVGDVLRFFEEHKLALNNAHVLVGDSTGNAVVIEWLSGETNIIEMEGNYQLATNYILSDNSRGNYPCYRYKSIQENIAAAKNDTMNLLRVGNFMGGAAQPHRELEPGRLGGTLYSTFIDITQMQFVLVYLLDNTKVTKLDLRKEFAQKQNRIIRLK